eukprot:s686_g6.t1
MATCPSSKGEDDFHTNGKRPKESVAVLCQLYMFMKEGRAQEFTSHFLAAQAMAKVMSFIFWASSFSELSDPNHHIKAFVGNWVVCAQLIQLLIMGDWAGGTGLGVLFSASKDALRIWSVKSATVSSWGRSIGCIPVINECTAVVWAASSRELVCGFATGSCVAFVLDGDEVTHMYWDDAKRRLFTSSKDKKLRVWHFPAVGRDFNPVASAVISSAPQLTAPRNAASMAETRRPATGSGPGATRQVATGYPDVSAAQPSKGPVRADESDDDLTGWDR